MKTALHGFLALALGRSSFLRHVLVLMSWTIVAQGISVVSMLALPRLFHPEQFGVFSVFSGLVVMLGIVAAARYEFAIGLPRSDADAAAIFTLCMGLATLAFVIFLVLLLVLPVDAIFPKLSALSPWWGWVALGAGCVGWYNAATYMALRVGDFSAVGRSKALIALVTALGQIVGGLFLSRGDGSLIVPFIVAQLTGSGLLIWALRGRTLWEFDRAVLVLVAGRYTKFPKYIAPGSLLDGLAVLLPVAAITALYSPAQAGIYALAERMLRVPVTLIGSPVLQVFYKRFAELRGDQHASRRLLLRTWWQMGAMALGPCILLAVFGEDIFSFLFGATWRESGRMAEIMALSAFFFFVSYPTSNILVVNELARSFLLWQTAQLVMIGAALWLASKGMAAGLVHTVAWIVAAQTSVYLLSMALQWHVVTASQAEHADDAVAKARGGN